MIKLIGDGHVLIKEFQTEDEGLDYMKRNKEDLMWYYGHYEIVVPGEKTIWAVSDTLISDEEFRKQVDAKRRAAWDSRTVDEGWGDEED